MAQNLRLNLCMSLLAFYSRLFIALTYKVPLRRSSKLVQERVSMNYFMLDTLKPNLLRPRPPLLEPSRDEAIWINPSIPIAPPSSCVTQSIWFEWDMMMGRLPPNDFSEAVELLNLAFTTTLSRDQMAKLVTELQGTPELLRDAHFTPQAFGQLIETNAEVAIQALVELIQCFETNITLSSNATFLIEEYAYRSLKTAGT